MRSLYLSQQGCALTLSHESILVKQGDEVLDEVQLPLLEQVLIFGQSQITTQAVGSVSCLQILHCPHPPTPSPNNGRRGENLSKSLSHSWERDLG